MMQEKYWQEELAEIKAILDTTDMEVKTKWGADVYCIDGRSVVSYGGFKNHFAVWFFNGVYLKDSDQVLVNANEENTKAMRQWRFTDASQIDRKKILAYVEEAMENERNGLRWEKEKSKVLELVPHLAKALKADASLSKSFEALTPYKQKEYNEYIETAKRESTKESRIEKIIPMIKNGVGLNDKYRNC